MHLRAVSSLALLSVICGGYEVDNDVEKWAERFINKEDAEKMRQELTEAQGEGYGTDFVYIPDGEGVPQKAVLSDAKQQKLFGFGEARDSETTTKPIGEDVGGYRNNPMEGQPLTVEDPDSIKSSSYDASKPTKIIIHGWKSSGDSDTVLNIKNAYLKRSDMNVVGVDWSPITSTYYYPTPAAETYRVGQHVGRLVDIMTEENGARHEDFHIIGHSLGAHVAGAAGASTRSKISRVTGLDPALPGFQYYQHAEGKLDETDAEFVEVIHTCSGALGMSAPAGHADFYPNGGSPFQPGCCCMPEFTEACSHGRAHQYFAESILNETPFESSRCNSWDQFKRADCAEEKVLMGEYTPTQSRGVYYLLTNSTPPYALGSEGAKYAT